MTRTRNNSNKDFILDFGSRLIDDIANSESTNSVIGPDCSKWPNYRSTFAAEETGYSHVSAPAWGQAFMQIPLPWHLWWSIIITWLILSNEIAFSGHTGIHRMQSVQRERSTWIFSLYWLSIFLEQWRRLTHKLFNFSCLSAGPIHKLILKNQLKNQTNYRGSCRKW